MVTISEVARALWDISNETGEVYYVALHPCGSMAIVKGDLVGTEKGNWCGEETVLKRLKVLKDQATRNGGEMLEARGQ